MGTTTPEIEERPEAGESGGKVLQPDCVRMEPVAENVGEAGNELVFDGWRAHEAGVIGPSRGIDEGGESARESESDGESGEELPGAREDDPGGKHDSERQEEMWFEGAKPERGSGAEWMAAMEAEKQD